MIKNFTPRLYQETILNTTIHYNTLVVLPTGLGKTNLFMMLAAKRLTQYPNSKILMLGPTRPLISQYKKVLEKHFEIEPEKMAIFTGHVKPEKRAQLWKDCQIIFSTPQGLENDIINKKIDLKDVSLLCFDEAHRATGEYSYVWIAKQFNKLARHPRILALTASPGSDIEKISEICKNLYIEEIESRSDQDPDVKPYIQNVKVNWVMVDFPEEFKEVQKYLNDCYKSKLNDIQNLGYLNQAQVQYASKTELLKVQAQLHSQIAQGDKSFEILKSVSLAAEAMKVQHAIELLETQGIQPLFTYLEKLQSQALTTTTKAIKNLVQDINFRSAFIKTDSLIQKEIEHPKIQTLKDMLTDEIQKNPKAKLILFTQYRDMGKQIAETINSIPNINANLFVGQTKKAGSGLSQKEQIAMIDDFREGKFNVLIATAVGEEGLDIPQVDKVIFYEPVPSAIRTIQRRGRTGRTQKGAVSVLVTKGTRDEGYRWSAHHKEKRMHKTLKDLKSKLELKKSGHLPSSTQQAANQPTQNTITFHKKQEYQAKKQMSYQQTKQPKPTLTLNDFSKDENQKTKQKDSQEYNQPSHQPTNPSSNNPPTNNSQSKNLLIDSPTASPTIHPDIIVDYREKGSRVIKELIELDINVSLERLEVGDYHLSRRSCVEYKKVEDFVNSIVDGRLLQQLKDLKKHFERPVIIVEGEQDIYNIRNIHPNAIRGMIATIAVSYGIPIIYTKNSTETASILAHIAKREQTEIKNNFSLHFEKRSSSLKDQQEYIVSSFPNIGPQLAKDLLEEFGSIREIVNASEEDLKRIDKLGSKKASTIKKILNEEYESYKKINTFLQNNQKACISKSIY